MVNLSVLHAMLLGSASRINEQGYMGLEQWMEET
jgi:hypothetical protein